MQRTAILSLLALTTPVARANAQDPQPDAASGEPIQFVDTTADAGLAGIKAHGVAWGDYDGDDAPDLLLAGLDRVWLFRNAGKGKFADVSEKTGIAAIRNASTGGGGFFADMDDDGDLDLFVAPHFLLRNDKGRFENVSAKAGLQPGDHRVESAAWGDCNGDGKLDLVLGRIGTDGGDPFAGGPLLLYVQDRAGHFRESAKALLQGMEDRSTRTPAWCDYDADGDLDLFVGGYRCFGDYLFENRGGKLVNVAKEAGLPQTPGQADENEHTIGVVWLDYDGDGDFDLCHHAQHTAVRLHRNDGGGKFTEVGKAAGVAGETTEHLGMTVGDFDNDGRPDLFYTVEREGGLGSVLLRNRGEGTFANVTRDSGLQKVHGFGTACADCDGDGDLDLMVTSEEHSADKLGLQEVRLFRNDTPTKAGWLDVRLLSKGRNTFGIGARVEVEAGGQKQLQQVTGGDGALSPRSHTLHFGLGTAEKVDRIVVSWPDGKKVETFPGAKLRSLHVLRKGGGRS